MNVNSFNKGMAILRASYPQSKIELTDDIREVWFAALQDLPDKEFMIAVAEIIKRETFFPAIATIRNYVAGKHLTMRERLKLWAEKKDEEERESGQEPNNGRPKRTMLGL